MMNQRKLNNLIVLHSLIFAISFSICYVLYLFTGSNTSITRVILVLLALQIGVGFSLINRSVLTVLKIFFQEKSSPYPLAIFRITFYSLLIGIYYHYQSQLAVLDLKNYSIAGNSGFDYLQVFVYHPHLYYWIYWLGIITAFLCVIGYRFRYLSVANIFFSFIIIGSPMLIFKVSYSHIWFWGTIFLACSPASDVLSVDSFSRKKTIISSAKYLIPLKFFWLQLGINYFFSAYNKLVLSGIAWSSPSNMVHQIHYEWLTGHYSLPIHLSTFSLALGFGGMLALLVEFCFIFWIFSTYTRWLALFGGLSIHWFTTIFMNLTFWDLQLIYLSFLPILFVNPRTNKQTSFQSETYLNRFFHLSMMVLVINSLLGLFNITSWPFSQYPTHATLIPKYLNSIVLTGISSTKDTLNLNEITQKNHFRVDDLGSRMEEAVLNLQNKDTAAYVRNVHLIWNQYQIGNPELKLIPCPQVSLETVNMDNLSKKEIPIHINLCE